ncbi:MAG: hypothetical protein KDA27_13805 [Candidatus Eisenbacteria bacterium]|uniref:RNA polymerase sigma-70 ECF-like HTH domain-containing protein n=1 Tax=Eiseniibacteriota bacterium TaxID=2212470 RepID=A0A956SF08_UNCEI|nr:hypothetical protein [Candidatus Eisenbacteria bacterium]
MSPKTEAILRLNFERLRARAHRMMDGERRFLTHPPTHYVHEAILRVMRRHSGLSGIPGADLFRSLVRELKRARIDHIRRRSAQKRGGRAVHVGIDCARDLPEDAKWLSSWSKRVLGEALDKLETRTRVGGRVRRVVELRAEGYSHGSIAEMVGVSRPTVITDLKFGLSWLRQWLESEE